jgi:probable rRNA maturation factor
MAATLHIFNHQAIEPVHLQWWQKVAKAAFPLCLAKARSSTAPLTSLEEIEFSLVSDEAIAKVHGDFMDDPTPTDVITFHHGEIIISLETASRQAREHGIAYENEVALYIIHGLLHLAGWEDTEPGMRAEMHTLQSQILDECLSQVGSA